MKLVVIESPFAGDVKRNIKYAKAAVRDSLSRGEAPYASHLFFTRKGILDDQVPSERSRGIDCGLAWAGKADLTAVYTDLGISRGMDQGIARAIQEGRGYVLRSIPKWKTKRPRSPRSKTRGG